MTDEQKTETTEEVTEEVVEEKPTEEKVEEKEDDTEEVVEDAAEKVMKLVNEKVAEITKANKAKEAKKDLVFSNDAKVEYNDYDVDLYTKKNGEKVKIKKYAAEHLGKWFKSFVEFGATHSPDAWQNMKKEYQSLEKFAQINKLEPLQTGVAADGGNLVPTILFNEIIPLLEDMAVIRPNSRVINMQGVKTLALPSIASKPYVSWNSETAQKGTTSVQFGQISLTPYILAGIIPVTTQLIDDSPFNVVQLVSELLAEAIAKAEDKAFIAGSGSGQPTGITTYTAGGVVDAGGALRFTHFNTAYFAMPQKHRTSSKAAWIMNSATLETVMNLQDGNNRPIVDIFNPLNGPGIPRIRGAKVLEQNDMSDNEIWFVDLNYYWIGYSRTLGIDIAREVSLGGKYDAVHGTQMPQNMWERNMIAIRAEEKVDGELVTTRAAVEIQNVRT